MRNTSPICVVYRRHTVYVTLTQERRLSRVNLDGDYLDVTDKLTEKDRARLEKRANRALDLRVKKEARIVLAIMADALTVRAAEVARG